MPSAGELCSLTSGTYLTPEGATEDASDFDPSGLSPWGSGTGRCVAGTRCSASDVSSLTPQLTPTAEARCDPCLFGHFCPTGSSNPIADASLSLCAAGHNCPVPSVQDKCPEGYMCAKGTHDGGIRCPDTVVVGTMLWA